MTEIQLTGLDLLSTTLAYMHLVCGVVCNHSNYGYQQSASLRSAY